LKKIAIKKLDWKHENKLLFLLEKFNIVLLFAMLSVVVACIVGTSHCAAAAGSSLQHALASQ